MQRLMAQYGFVLRDGNAADRLVLQPFEPSSITTTAQSSRAAEGGAGPSAQPFSSSSGVLNLERMQNVMGDAMFKAMLQGNSPRIFAALKSLPLADDALENAPVGVAAGAAAAADGRGGVDMAAAQHYLSQCEAELASSKALKTNLHKCMFWLLEKLAVGDVDSVRAFFQCVGMLWGCK